MVTNWWKKRKLEEATKLSKQGVDLYQRNRLNEAIKKWKVAKPIFVKFKIPHRVAHTDRNIGLALANLGRFDEALGHYKAARLLFMKLNMPHMVAQIYINIGHALDDLGKPAEALKHYQVAKPIYENLNKLEGVADAEMNIGASLRALGRPAEALKHYQVAKPIYEKLNMPHMVADTELNIGNALVDLGRFDEALRHYQTVKPVYEKLNMLHRVAQIEYCIGNVLYSIGNPVEAIRHYEAAKPIYEKLNKPHRVADIEMNIGLALVDLDRPAEALRRFKAVRPVYEKLNKPHRVADTELNIGLALANLGRPAEALKKFIIALDVYEKMGFPMKQSMAYRNMGEASRALGDIERALHDWNRSLELMERVRTGVRSPELQRSLKKQYLDISDSVCAAHLVLWKREDGSEHLDGALNTVELAKCSTVAESLEAGGGEVPCPEMEKLIIEENRLLSIAKQEYHKMEELQKLWALEPPTIRLEIRDSSAYDAVHKKIERLRSEILVKCADVGSTPIPRTYNVLKRTLEVFPRDERWGILEFAISSVINELIVFLVDQDGFIQCAVHGVNRKEVKNLVSRCLGIVKKVRNRKWEEADGELDVLSKQLYATLIPEEIGKALKSRDLEHLIVVPHKLLHLVPFEVLFDGDSYWGLKYAISTDFSLDLARLCVEKREKRAKKIEESLSFLLVKDPLLDIKEKADEEVDSIRNLLEAQRIQYEVLEHERATQPAFIGAANERPFSVLHHIGHALFVSKNPSLSHLYLHTDRECPACSGKTKEHTSELLTATEIIHRVKFKRTPIVYLSACETGIAEVEPGDEMFGLVRALMYAGATSLVLSLWPVRDPVAPVFAEEFYRQLLGGESVAVALRNARRNVFNDDPLKFTDWAVFSLQGDPFRRLA